MANCRLTVFSSFFFFSCVAYCSTPLCHVYCIYTLPSTFGPGEIEATMPPYLLLVTGNDIARIERQSRWQQVSLVSVTMSFFSMYLYLCIPTGSWGGTKRKRFWFALLNCSIELDKVRNKGNKSGNPASSETLLKGRVGPPINNFRRRCYFHVSLALSLSGRVPVMKGVRNSPPTLAMLWNIDANNMKTNAINSLFSFCLFFSSKLSKRETN